jgi:hypothetical protein
MNISDKLIEQWSIDIFNSVKLYGVSVFAGHEDDDINGKIILCKTIDISTQQTSTRQVCL